MNNSTLNIQNSKFSQSRAIQAVTYPDKTFVQEVLAQMSWYHNITLIQKVKNEDIRKWYISKTIENSWFQIVLVHQIESELYNGSDNIDLLFYHLKLRCCFVIELKNVEFKPEFAGKLNIYLSAIDDLVKSDNI